MSFENLQTLALILLFLTPGALFIYVCALNYSPSMRAKYLREQFPLELTIFYLIVSTVIHTIMVLIALGIMYLIGIFLQTHPLEYLMSIVTQRVALRPQDVTFLLIFISTYFLSSLVLAYLGGRLLGKLFVSPTPLWQGLLARMQAEAESKSRQCWVQLRLRDQRKLSGNLVDFQCWAKGPDSFQLLISEGTGDIEEGGKQGEKCVWIDSREILEMDLQAPASMATFIFAEEE